MNFFGCHKRIFFLVRHILLYKTHMQVKASKKLDSNEQNDFLKF